MIDPPERFCSSCDRLVTTDAAQCPDCGGWVTTFTEPNRKSHEYVVGVKDMLLAEREDLKKNQRRPKTSDRPRLVPDAESTIRDAVLALRKSRTRLTWTAVAMWMRENVENCETIDRSTIERWAREDDLPKPSDRTWIRS